MAKQRNISTNTITRQSFKNLIIKWGKFNVKVTLGNVTSLTLTVHPFRFCIELLTLNLCHYCKIYNAIKDVFLASPSIFLLTLGFLSLSEGQREKISRGLPTLCHSNCLQESCED